LTIVFGLLRDLVVTVLVLASVGAIGLYIAVPYLERDMTFFPGKYDRNAPWRLPPGASDVYFPTSDGIRLHGWFLEGADPKTGITVLLLHGNAGTLSDFSPDAVILQNRGFDVLLVDYRGYGRSEGETLSEATLKLDGLAAMRYLTTDRKLDRMAIALLGYSLGTTVATDLAVSGPCRAIALVAPMASARRQAKEAMTWLPDLFFDRMRNRFDNVGKIGRVNCPVLVVHGSDDEVISVAHGRAVYDAAPQPKRLFIVRGGRHWLPTSSGRGYLDEIASFFSTSP
jgi:pimeloyl-ACP methyl ester carboxylesterase